MPPRPQRVHLLAPGMTGACECGKAGPEDRIVDEPVGLEYAAAACYQVRMKRQLKLVFASGRALGRVSIKDRKQR